MVHSLKTPWYSVCTQVGYMQLCEEFKLTIYNTDGEYQLGNWLALSRKVGYDQGLGVLSVFYTRWQCDFKEPPNAPK